MSESPRIPLLGSLPSSSAADLENTQSIRDGRYAEQGVPRSRSSSSSLAKREEATRRAVNSASSSPSTPYATLKKGDVYEISAHEAYTDAIEVKEGMNGHHMTAEDDNDLVAISGSDRLARSNISQSPGYRQIDGNRFGYEKTKPEVIKRVFVVLALIASWFFFSTLMNLYNSWLFSSKRHNFSYPLFVTSMHMFVQFGLSSLIMIVCHRNRKIVPRRRNGKRARPEARDWATKVVPCALATALDIGLSNLSLKTITLTFYTMCKSSNLAFVLFFAFLFKLEKLRWSLVGIIALITIGVIMMVAAETQFVLEGAVQVLTASAMGGLRWALTQMLLHKKQMGMNNPIATIFWLSPLMGFFMIVSSAVLEDWFGMFSSTFFQTFTSSLSSIFLMIAPGFIAFLMTLSEFALIQRTSVITLSVAGIFKEIATIMLSSSVFGDELTPINVTGLCIALTGIALYNYLKYRLMVAAIDSGKHHYQVGGEDDEDHAEGGEMEGTKLIASHQQQQQQHQRSQRQNESHHTIGDESSSSNGTYRQVPIGDEEGHSGFDADAEELTREELDRRRKREEEADMEGWSTSGFVRTGGGYDDGDDTR